MRARYALGAAGVALCLVGAWTFVTGVPARQWLGVGTWLAGGVVGHDALLAPAALVLGWLVLPRVAARWRPVLRTALLACATASLILLPLLATR